jgi:5'-deoxynucleotidase YfbR-like HD superfamily hydrolase
MNITQIHQSDVNRWHANRSPKLRNSGDTTDKHSLRMIKLLIALFPNFCDTRLSAIVALHDFGESQLGDVSGKAKKEHPQLAAALDQAEAENRAAMGLTMPKLNETEWRILHFLDRLDAVMWCNIHDPEQLLDPDWQECIEWLAEQADALRVDITEVLEAMP